jgi:IPT/TIG domain-containing protein
MQQTNGFRLKLFTLSIALGASLVGCDGGSYDANTGRITFGPSTAAASANSGARALTASDSAQPSYGSAQGPSAPAQPSPSYDRPAPASYTGSQSASGSDQGSFDAFSRTPPAPQLQADGTPMKPLLAQVSPPSGEPEGGNEVLITGSGFANAQVMFGGQLARITSQSSNAITVVAPEGASGRPVSVVVTNRDGSYAVAGAAYSYR